MACTPLSAGIPKGCESNTGGLLKCYITDHENILSVTVGTDGVIDAITMASGTEFYDFSFPRNSSNHTDDATITPEVGGLFYNQVVTLVIPRRENAKREVMSQLMQKDLAIIVQDYNGIYWLLGEERGAMVTAKTSGSGTAKADLNGYTLTITAEEPEAAREIDPTIIAGLIA